MARKHYDCCRQIQSLLLTCYGHIKIAGCLLHRDQFPALTTLLQNFTHASFGATFLPTSSYYLTTFSVHSHYTSPFQTCSESCNIIVMTISKGRKTSTHKLGRAQQMKQMWCKSLLVCIPWLISVQTEKNTVCLPMMSNYSSQKKPNPVLLNLLKMLICVPRLLCNCKN